jgi:hypothetical protein
MRIRHLLNCFVGGIIRAHAAKNKTKSDAIPSPSPYHAIKDNEAAGQHGQGKQCSDTTGK